MLRKAFHSKVEAIVTPWIRFLDQKGVSPNHLTLAGLVVNILAGWAYASGAFFLGGLLLIIAGLGDMLDGPLARLSGRASRFGAFLDSTIDRYSDFVVFAGIALFYARTGHTGWFLITMGIILGSIVTSYTKARAENLIENCSVGIFERTERVVTLALGSFIPVLLPFALWILLLGTNVTALHRIFYTRKRLTETEK